MARNFPAVPGAEYCGFRSSGIPPDFQGPCTVNVTAVSRNGQAREATCHVVINWKTPPEMDCGSRGMNHPPILWSRCG